MFQMLRWFLIGLSQKLTMHLLAVSAEVHLWLHKNYLRENRHLILPFLDTCWLISHRRNHKGDIYMDFSTTVFYLIKHNKPVQFITLSVIHKKQFNCFCWQEEANILLKWAETNFCSAILSRYKRAFLCWPSRVS